MVLHKTGRWTNSLTKEKNVPFIDIGAIFKPLRTPTIPLPI